jgi:hypothetical protein
VSRTFAVDTPRSCSVNRLTVHSQPTSDLEQDRPILVWDRTVGTWTDVQKQRTVLAHDIDKVADNIGRTLVIVIVRVPPGILGNGGIRLPEVFSNLCQLAALDIQHGGSDRKRFMFVIDRNAPPPFMTAIVVVAGELLEIGSKDRLLDPPVVPDTIQVAVWGRWASRNWSLGGRSRAGPDHTGQNTVNP